MWLLTRAVALVAVAAMSMAAVVVNAPRDSYPVVEVGIPNIGDVTGQKIPTHNKVKEVWHFLGIPYVDQPERFAPPEKFKNFGYHDGRNRAQMCPQAKFYPSDLSGEIIERLLPDSQIVGEGEDCLTLDIYTPLLPGKDGAPSDVKLLPVFFFIHGGAFVVGSSKSAQPDYILERADMVIVSIQYRLGPLGFLAIDGGEDGNFSNAGLHDQMWALKWTHEHIRHFGGDPEDIVIGGVSAGGATSGLLYVSPRTRDWVKGALLFSGCSVVPWTIDLTPQRSLEGHASRVGCGNVAKEDLLACMRKVDPEAILSATFDWARAEKKEARLGMGGTIPVIDGDLLPTLPEDILKDPEFPGRPLVIGVTKHEGVFIYVQVDAFYIRENKLETDPYTLKHEFGDILLRFAGIHDMYHVLGEAIHRLYFTDEQLGDYAAMWPGTIDFAGSAFFKAPAWHMAKLNADREGTSYLYTFNYISQDGRHEEPAIANHGSDQIYLFPARNESFKYRDEDMRMTEQFTEMVANFVVHKKPTTPGTDMIHGAQWLPATREDANYLIIDDTWEGKKGFTNEYFVVNEQPTDPGDGNSSEGPEDGNSSEGPGDGNSSEGPGDNDDGSGNSLKGSAALLLVITAILLRI